MSAQLHWWLPAVSFALGMVLTGTMLMRPAKLQVPAWASADPVPERAAKPEPPAMKTQASEAPTQRIPVARPRPVKKAGTKAPPRKRRPVLEDAATEQIPVARKRPVKKMPAKKAPAKKIRPREPARRRDPATEKIPVAEEQTVQLPLVPYAPYGPGSLRANADGTGPEGWPVKGRTDARLFYTADDPGYDDIEAQVWFENEDFARRAFFMPGRNSARQSETDDSSD